MKTYLVTGGAGFIGSNFIKYILDVSRDAYIVNVDKLTYAGNLDNIIELADHPRHVFAQVDICDATELEKLFEKFKPDFVVNFAAESHVDRSIQNADDFINTNVVGTGNLLKLCKQFWEIGDGMYGDKKYLQVSTDEVYGSLSLEDTDEFFVETTPLNPHSPSSASKAAADLLVKAYFDTHRLPVNITRCSNNYGPYQFPEKLIPLCISNATEHKNLPVYGDGQNVRDWLFVKDHCKAIDMVLEYG
ncbi:MAG: GDP-mannose 4,6-dehydratase, partial [Coriobacteriales bacterium]|nr:GDP-mannose 4,6-dehydratase [Coriobacteriales bacterium]